METKVRKSSKAGLLKVTARTGKILYKEKVETKIVPGIV